MTTAVITGITGQDGSYLAEFLLAQGYQVHDFKRRSSSFNTSRVDHLYQDFHATDASWLARLLSEIRPNEIYNLAAQSHVKVSFETPEYTGDIVALGWEPSVDFPQLVRIMVEADLAADLSALSASVVKDGSY